MERLRPEDDYFLRCESADAPMHIGALQLFDAPAHASGSWASAVREHLAARLPATPLSRVRHLAPDEYDSDVWCDVAACDLDAHLEVVPGPLDRAALHRLVERAAMQRLDLSRPPFFVHVVESLEGGGAALFWRVHHAVADGIGFQTLMERLMDAEPDAPPPRVPARVDESPPAPDAWRAASEARFAREAEERERGAADRAGAKADLRAFQERHSKERALAGRLPFEVPSSRDRCYATVDLSLPRLRAAGRALGGTVNDAFVTVVSGAVRSVFGAQGLLPEVPVLGMAARSYRRPEHGDYGNRVVNLMPHMATHLADVRERFAYVRHSMQIEIERSRLLEALAHDYDRPYAARGRRENFETKLRGGTVVLPGQVVVSNVPGPGEPRYLAGRRLAGSYPAPLLGYGRVVNVTSRRYQDALQCGVMTDPAMWDDVGAIADALRAAQDELEAAALR